MMRKITTLSACALTGVAFIAGGLVGYQVAKRNLEQHYIDLANEEIKEAKEYYEKEVDKKTPSAEASDGRERIFYHTLREYQGTKPVQTPHAEAKQVLKSIFRNPPPENDPDFDAEVEARDPNHPYIIAVTEFLSNDSNYSQETLTWYMRDSMLIDDQDEPVEDPEGVIGLGNLQFGHRSDQENAVYIRNDRLLIDFEVVRHEGSYAQVVLGLTPEGA